MKKTGFLLLTLMMALSACGGSNGSNGSSNTIATSTCIAVSGTSQTCIATTSPVVEYQGPATITNTGEAAFFINSFYGGQKVVSTSNKQALTQAKIDVTISSLGTTPSIIMSINFPLISQTWFSGPTFFFPKSGSTTIGEMYMQPYIGAGTSLQVTTLTQPWDGSAGGIGSMLSTVTVGMDAVTNAGSATLYRVQ